MSSLPISAEIATIWPRCTLAPKPTARSARRSRVSASRAAVVGTAVMARRERDRPSSGRVPQGRGPPADSSGLDMADDTTTNRGAMAGVRRALPALVSRGRLDDARADNARLRADLDAAIAR